MNRAENKRKLEIVGPGKYCVDVQGPTPHLRQEQLGGS